MLDFVLDFLHEFSHSGRYEPTISTSQTHIQENTMTQTKRFSDYIALVVVATLAISATTAAYSQDEDSASQRRQGVLEEVIVTATKRDQSIQDVGIAVTAMTGEQMEALGFTSAQQVAAAAPGVSSLQPNGEANYSIGIRGVINSDFTTNVESPVAVYLDEVYISQASGTGFMLFDMERVEILRGPQGTLYGRNATGGLAHFITKKPGQDADGYGKLTVGQYGQVKFEGAAGGPIGTSALSARISGSIHRNKGYIENRVTDVKLNNANDWAVRLQLLYEPSDDLSLLLNVRGSAQDIRTGFFENVSSATDQTLTPTTPNEILSGYLDEDGNRNVYAGDYDDPGFNDLSNRGYSATLKYALNDSVNLTTITDYSTTKRTYIEDSDASPEPFFNFFLTTDAKQFSQEVRFDYEGYKWKWLLGAYYLKLDINDTNGAITEPFIMGGGTTRDDSEGGLLNPYTSELDSLSLFGQVEYLLSDQLTLIAGLRVIQDKKDFVYRIEAVEFLDPDSTPGFNAPSNIASQGVLGNYDGRRDDSDIAGRLQLDWKFSDNNLAYFAYNRGVRGGGFNAPIFPVNAPLDYNDETFSYGPEQLNAFEVGLKVDLGDIGRLNTAVYYYDYNNYQLFTITGVDTITVNSPSAEAKGFEVELQLSPSYRWDFLAGLAYNDISAKAPGVTDEVRPVQSPKWNANALVRYNIPVGNGEISLQADLDYRSEVFFNLTAAEPVTQGGFAVANILISYSLGDHWMFSGFVQNVTDEEYQVQAFDLSGPMVFGLTEQYYGRPRWWGVSARYNF